MLCARRFFKRTVITGALLLSIPSLILGQDSSRAVTKDQCITCYRE